MRSPAFRFDRFGCRNKDVHQHKFCINIKKFVVIVLHNFLKKYQLFSEIQRKNMRLFFAAMNMLLTNEYDNNKLEGELIVR